MLWHFNIPKSRFHCGFRKTEVATPATVTSVERREKGRRATTLWREIFADYMTLNLTDGSAAAGLSYRHTNRNSSFFPPDLLPEQNVTRCPKFSTGNPICLQILLTADVTLLFTPNHSLGLSVNVFRVYCFVVAVWC